MATPFDSAGGLDLQGSVALARWLVDHGNDALVLAGTTGESPALSDEEKVQLWTAVASAVAVPVIAGTGTADTAHSVELTQAATSAGAAGILAVTPYYNRPSQTGIESHMRAIAGATHLPVLVYDIPVRTGRRVSSEVIWRLARDGVIAGVKDATADPAGAARLVAGAPSGFELYSGNDADTLPLLAVGAVGVISVESHWAGETVRDMVAHFFKGDLQSARAFNAALMESHRFQSSDDTPNPVPTKAMLRHLGLPAGQCRLPMGDAPEGLAERAAEVFSHLQVSRG